MTADLISGKALVFESGGPTRVINASLRGVVETLQNYMKIGSSHGGTPVIEGIYGSISGVRGVLEENFVDLTKTSASHLYKVSRTPAAALGTTRYELYDKDKEEVKKEDVDTAISVLKAHNIRYIFTIGGGDSSETAQILQQGAIERDYKLTVIHVPKTIDNDLPLMDHCPGYPSVATYNANCLIGTWFDARSSGKAVDLNVTMGRDAGWIAAAGIYGRKRGYRPLIVTPENPMEPEEFFESVRREYRDNEKLLQVIVSEGAKGSKGKWAETLADSAGIRVRQDDIGRKVLSDVPLTQLLKPGVEKATDGARVVQNTLGYPQRSFVGVWSELDYHEAHRAAEMAVEAAMAGVSGKMISIQRVTTIPYEVSYHPVQLSEVAVPGEKKIRRMPSDFFDYRGQPNDMFANWLDPLIGDIDETAILEAPQVHRIVRR